MPESKSSQGVEFNKVQREVLRSNSKPEFRAAVGLSREWDARKAGREVARDTLEKLGTDPDFFLLFSTIHYEKWGGFKEFLAGVWDVLPEGTPLIGGTVAGFIIPQGCFVRGATALAVSYPNMDVAVGIGRNTKRAPHLAAKQCAEMIKRKLDKSKYTNKLIIYLISGPIIAKFPLIGYRNMVTSYFLGEFLTKLLQMSYLMDSGLSREEEVLEKIHNQIGDSYLIGSSLMDNGEFLSNYQFYNDKVITDSLILLGVVTDMKFKLGSAHGLHATDLKFKITEKKNNGKVLSKLDNKPATNRLFSSLGFPSIKDKKISGIERLYRRLYYYPLAFKKRDKYYPLTIGAILGKNVIVGASIDANDAEVLTASGMDILKATNEVLAKVSDKALVCFLVSCAIRLNTLGEKVYVIHKKLIKTFDRAPFLLIYGSGENVKWPNKAPEHYNMSFNALTSSY